jgi:putative membrane-bound dehydrogenase-like protein
MHPLLLSLLVAAAPAPTPPEGVLPVGADGRPLNLDFETGTLRDWTADGDAFRDQPVEGDTVAARRGDMQSRHQGRFWVGSYERRGDRPTGTLTSAAFTVTYPWASFLVGGGSFPETCVELILQPRNEVVYRASGVDREDMDRVAVDLSKYVGRQIQVRLVDRHTGGWGHVNFDDFRFHAAKPAFPARPTKGPPAKPDEYRFAGLPPDKAAEAMTVPEGFQVTLFAGEPDVHQPVAFTIDDRGRLWVAEAYVYPKRLPFPGARLPEGERQRGDRILIFEDTDGDGKFDKKTQFIDGLNLVSGLEVGFGGVWVGAAPYLMFIPDKDGDDKPDAEPQVLLDGWHYEDTHETLNAFTWGPDGWLYGCHGVFTHSRVGKPGTPDKDRTPINAGVWRYHPTRHTFEVFAHGTSNPWGLDYNEYGDFFVEACVIPHLFHVVQGGRYQRQAGQHFNPYTYADIQTIADHRHYVGATPHGGNNVSDSTGGGHAHCGLMCYLGGTWPKEHHGKLFMGNIHGRRINVDVLKPKGSGYVASHGKDFLLANDAWARFINLKYGPDGNVYLIDWYDKQACHKTEPEIWDRTNGRVYKVSYKGAKPVTKVDLQKCSDEELVKYQIHDNDWYARHARRILQERLAGFVHNGAEAWISPIAFQDRIGKPLAEIARTDKNPVHRLRAVWALHAVDKLRYEDLERLAADTDEHVRAWAVRLAVEPPGKVNADGQRFAVLLKRLAGDPSAAVRRAVVTAVRNWGPGEAVQLDVFAAVAAKADPGDPLLPHLLWYAIEPLIGEDPEQGLMAVAKVPGDQLLAFATRRVGAIGTPEAFAVLVKHLADAKTADHQLAYLRGLADGLRGRRNVRPPDGWAAAYAALAKSDNPEVRAQALAVGVALRDPAAADALLAVVADPKAEPAARQNALAALLDVGHSRLAGVLKELLREPAMRGVAVRGLGRVADDGVPAAVLAVYPSLTAAEKRDAVAALAGRAKYAHALLDAVAARKLPAADVPAESVRQLRNLGDPTLDAKVAAVWGTVRESPAERKQLIAAWTAKLGGNITAPPPAMLSHGRAVFARVCQQCHTLYGVGGKVGPDITGANRADLGYLLENIFDPSAVIPKDYAATKLDLADGRVVTGIVKEETPRTLTVVTATETLTVPTADVEKRTPSDRSMMPDDLTQQLKEDDLRALIAYLRHPSQVPVGATAENAKEFFNGKDLAGWAGDKTLWSVENGEIVGRSREPLRRNQFLVSQMAVADFRLTLKVKLTPNAANSGVQFRSEPLPDGEMRGPQADAGAGWWGKLYEESGRGLLWKESGEKHVVPDDWNEYVIEANGPRVRTWLNGHLCVDMVDPQVSRHGVVGLQLHSGGPLEVRFKDVKLEVFR